MDRKIGKYLQSMNVIADNEEALTKKESFVNTKQGDRRMTAAFNKQGPRKTSLKPQANTQQTAQTPSLQSYLRSTFNPI